MEKDRKFIIIKDNDKVIESKLTEWNKDYIINVIAFQSLDWNSSSVLIHRQLRDPNKDEFQDS